MVMYWTFSMKLEVSKKELVEHICLKKTIKVVF
jgi:hypothetical protein